MLLVLLVVYGFSKHKNQARKINDIQVSFGAYENLFLTHEKVNNLLIQKFGDLVNKPKSLVDLHEIENSITNHPMVSKSEVSVGLSGEMKVRVHQREPVARVCSNFATYYLDTEGQEMPLSKNYSARVVLVDNKNGNIKNDEVFPLIEKIEQTAYLKKSIVCVKKEEEGYKMLSRNNREWIVLGTLENLEDKLFNLKTFYNYSKDKELRYKKIDLQYHNQVVCSK